jgi:hypothetical protein
MTVDSKTAKVIVVAPCEIGESTMRATKLSFPAALMLTAGLTGGAAGWQAPGEKKQTADDGALAARVDKRIQAWQPTSAERRLDEIGWAKDLRDALRLAKENSRPVFLFTYSGSSIRDHAIAQQRC